MYVVSLLRLVVRRLGARRRRTVLISALPFFERAHGASGVTVAHGVHTSLVRRRLPERMHDTRGAFGYVRC